MLPRPCESARLPKRRGVKRTIVGRQSGTATGCLLKTTGFLSALDHAATRDLLSRGARKYYPPGETIFAQGSAGSSMLSIETGRVEVSSPDEQGQRVVLGQLGPGDLVGELALLDRGIRSADAIASRPVTGTLITLSDLRAFLMERPQVSLAILADLAAKLRAANAIAEDRAIRDGAARLARSLLRLAERWGTADPSGAIRFEEAFSQGELARVAGLTRETVNRRLSTWSRRGLLAQEDGRMVVRDPRLLERIARGTEGDA